MNLPELTQPDRLALFLDFDGTLVEIADRPDAVTLQAETRTALERLQGALGGALAIVTGRDIDLIDAMLDPFRCPVAGVHGLTRRDAIGRLHAKAATTDFIDETARQLTPLIEQQPGLILERKSTAIALHYRARPELEGVCLAAMETAVRAFDGVRLLRGKCVIEARPAGGDKGTAVADFMAEPPFAGRQPVFAGDDATDEDAFRLLNARGGITLKIGPGETVAAYRATNTAAFLAWLGETARRFTKG